MVSAECLVEEFIVRGKWTGNATTYEGAAAPAALYDANAEWTGGFDSSTKQDECAAMACFDCICKEKVMDVAMMYVGLAADDDAQNFKVDYVVSIVRSESPVGCYTLKSVLTRCLL